MQNEAYKELINEFKENIKVGYEEKLKKPIFAAKQKKINKVALRNDY